MNFMQLLFDDVKVVEQPFGVRSKRLARTDGFRNPRVRCAQFLSVLLKPPMKPSIGSALGGNGKCMRQQNGVGYAMTSDLDPESSAELLAVVDPE